MLAVRANQGDGVAHLILAVAIGRPTVLPMASLRVVNEARWAHMITSRTPLVHARRGSATCCTAMSACDSSARSSCHAEFHGCTTCAERRSIHHRTMCPIDKLEGTDEIAERRGKSTVPLPARSIRHEKAVTHTRTRVRMIYEKHLARECMRSRRVREPHTHPQLERNEERNEERNALLHVLYASYAYATRTRRTRVVSTVRRFRRV